MNKRIRKKKSKQRLVLATKSLSSQTGLRVNVILKDKECFKTLKYLSNVKDPNTVGNHEDFLWHHLMRKHKPDYYFNLML